MTFAEVVQLVNAGGVLVFAWFVLSELRLIRPLLHVIAMYLAGQAPPDVAQRIRKLTPPPVPRGNASSAPDG